MNATHIIYEQLISESNMKIWGKVLGAIFGFMLSKTILGALIGMWIGHTFDRGRSINFNRFHAGREGHRQTVFLHTTFSVMGHIAKAKGRVTQHEIQFASLYMDKFGLKGESRAQVQDAFREGKMAGFPLQARLEELKQLSQGREDVIMMFLEIQIQIAFADGKLESIERNVLHTIASHLGFSRIQLDRLLEMIIAGAQFHGEEGQQYSGNNRQSGSYSTKQQLDNAYKVLGVSAQNNEKEIKRAYKKLMSQNHPDKLIAKGLPKEMMDIATQKTQDIQSAYELITKSR